jgi:hypothetical protein
LSGHWKCRTFTDCIVVIGVASGAELFFSKDYDKRTRYAASSCLTSVRRADVLAQRIIGSGTSNRFPIEKRIRTTRKLQVRRLF